MSENFVSVLASIQEKMNYHLAGWALDYNIYPGELIFQLGTAAAIFITFWLGRGLFTGIILRILMKFTNKTKTNIDDHLLNAFKQPLRLFFLGLGIYLTAWYLPLRPDFDAVLSKTFRSLVIILISSGIYNFVGSYAILRKDMEKLLGTKLDKTLIPFLSKILKVVIIALTVTIIAEEWGFKVNSFIAGLGLGGLAFALAAKDTVANIFGGIIIITDKPFSIGDWILTPSVEGTVEDINFRSTKVRVFSQAIVTVPNSTLANEPVTNWSRMGKRRVTFRLGVTYSTNREKLETCIKSIKQMLTSHPDIHQETIFVTFDSFGNSSLEIFLYFFTKTTVWENYLFVKEDVNFKIMDIVKKHGVSLAFPSTSVYFETPYSTPSLAAQNTANRAKMDRVSGNNHQDKDQE